MRPSYIAASIEIDLTLEEVAEKYNFRKFFDEEGSVLRIEGNTLFIDLGIFQAAMKGGRKALHNCIRSYGHLGMAGGLLLKHLAGP